jgi:hypothetical protein
VPSDSGGSVPEGSAVAAPAECSASIAVTLALYPKSRKSKRAM